MKITWLGHSCFRLDSAAGSLVLDPYADGSVPGLTLPQQSADAVLCSHYHDDHGAAEKVMLTGRPCGYEVGALECFHDEAEGAKRGKNLVHIVSAEGVRVVHLGDLGHGLDEGRLEKIGRPDVLLLPVGGFFTIDARQAKTLADAIGARITVPMHYRGEGFGYDVIGPLEEYTGLCGDVVYAGSNSFDPACYAERATLVLRLPE